MHNLVERMKALENYTKRSHGKKQQFESTSAAGDDERSLRHRRDRPAPAQRIKVNKGVFTSSYRDPFVEDCISFSQGGRVAECNPKKHGTGSVSAPDHGYIFGPIFPRGQTTTVSIRCDVQLDRRQKCSGYFFGISVQRLGKIMFLTMARDKGPFCWGSEGDVIDIRVNLKHKVMCPVSFFVNKKKLRTQTGRENLTIPDAIGDDYCVVVHFCSCCHQRYTIL